MLKGGASMAIASMWASMATWSTPTVLFCVLNLVIATIFIASNFKSHNHHPHNSPSQLTRSPSFLQRVKSVNLSSFYYNEVSHDEHQVHYDSTGYNSVSQLNRAPSLLQRVKSIDFSNSFPSFYSAPDDHLLNEHHHESEHSQRDSTSQLTRVPSILERVKSIKFTTQSVQPSKSTDTFSSDDQRSDMDLGPHQYRVHDDDVTSLTSGDSGVAPVEKSSTSLTKSSSERRVAVSVDDNEDVYRRRPATMRESVVVHDESVDAKADDFIRRFKQQLKLQRIDSLKRFRDMLNRGTSSG